MRYVAIGDSFTEGVGDPRDDGSLRGWADRVAEGLAHALGQPIEYANLSIRGRLLEPILDEQLEPALALKPDVLTFNGGGNDMMRPGADMDRLIRLTRSAIERCLAEGVRPVLLSGGDPTANIPLGRTIHARGSLLTRALAELVREHGLVFVNMFEDAELRRRGYWTADRIHLNAWGHERVAAKVLEALGHPTEARALEQDSRRRSLRAEAAFAREHLLPWVQRRVQGRSSGDGREPKHPQYIAVQPGQGSTG